MNKIKFSSEEEKFYIRQLKLKGFGTDAQKKLKNSRVLVVGAGGLGVPALLYLNAAGVGTLGIADGDKVALSNLHRQVLYNFDDVGKPKAETAAERLKKKNPFTNFRVYNEVLTYANILETLSEYDLILDCTDRFDARYLISDACVLRQKPCVYAAVFRFEGQLSVFNALLSDGTRSPHYRDLYPSEPSEGEVPNCAEDGVLGVLPGILGAAQAAEAIKLLTGTGTPLTGKVLLYDIAGANTDKLRFKAAKEQRINRQFFEQRYGSGIPEAISSETAKKLLKTSSCLTVDVRTHEERRRFHIGGLHIPEENFEVIIEKTRDFKQILFYCQSGKRAQSIAKRIKTQYPLKDISFLDASLSDMT